MAMFSTSLSSSFTLPSSSSFTSLCNFPSYSSPSLLTPPNPNKFHHHIHRHHSLLLLKQSPIVSDTSRASYRYSSGSGDDEEDEDGGSGNFEEAVALFNGGDYYKCHDSLEALWFESHDPLRTLFHGILQCSVGFHHLFNQNHKGAMMELGEGLCKLRKMNFDSGPFHQFEQEISAVLDFIYQTQLELAACADDYCLAMDQSDRSYQLLGGYAAGQRVYRLEGDSLGIMHIAFCPERSYGSGEPQMVKVKLPMSICGTSRGF